ncbi:hypothetical protein ACFLYT_01275, partial [Nanoarchaeota archaeon]
MPKTDILGEDFREAMKGLTEILGKLKELELGRLNFWKVVEDEKKHLMETEEGRKIVKLAGQVERLTGLAIGYLKEVKGNDANKIMQTRTDLIIELKRIAIDTQDEKVIKSANRINHAVRDDEVEWLQYYKADVKKWRQYLEHLINGEDITAGIEQFSIRLHGFIKGKGDLKGLEQFRDNVVISEIEENHDLKQLRRYQEEIELFKKWLHQIKDGLKEKDWHDFEEFYHKLPYERKVIQKYFGSKEFASEMGRFVKKYHESPEKWGEELESLLSRLKSPKYFKEVVEKAKEDLIKIFNDRIKALEKKHDKVITRNIRYVRKVVKGQRVIITDDERRKEFLSRLP